MKAIVMSINPRFVEKIFSGEKVYEYRKNVAKQKPEKIIIYSTSPVSAIVGEAVIETVIVNNPEVVWEQTKLLSGVDEDFFFEYYNNRNVAIAYKLTCIKKYDNNKELADFGIKFAPQSFVYLL